MSLFPVGGASEASACERHWPRVTTFLPAISASGVIQSMYIGIRIYANKGLYIDTFQIGTLARVTKRAERKMIDNVLLLHCKRR